jgi:hypothetical protein
MDVNGTTRPFVRKRVAGLAVLGGVAIGAVLTLRSAPDAASDLPFAALPGTSGTVVPPPVDLMAAHGAAMLYELREVQPGVAALLARHEAPPRWVRQGETIAPGLILADVGRSFVLLREGGREVLIALPARIGGGEPVPPEQAGLRPEPRPASGERSAAEIVAQVAEANRMTPVQPTAEELGTAELP